MARVRHSGTVILSLLGGIVGLACAALLLPAPAWASTDRGEAAAQDAPPDQLSGLISQLSNSRVFDSLVRSHRERFAQDQLQTTQPQQSKIEGQPQQAAKFEPQLSTEGQPQQAAKFQPQQSKIEGQPQQAAKF